MTIIIKLALYSLLMYGITFIVPGVAINMIWPTAVIAGVIFFFFNTVIKPVLKLLTLPITIITLGLFSIVLNAIVFWGTAYFVTGFTVADIKSAVIGGVIAAIGGWLIGALLDNDSE